MSKLYLLFEAIILDAIVVFLFSPVHFIYLSFRHGPEFAGWGKMMVLPLIFSLILLYLINTGYTMLKLAYDDLNAFAKTRWFGVWLMLHSLLYLYWELTVGGLSAMYYVECLVSALLYLGLLIYLHFRIYTKLQMALSQVD